MAEFLENIMAGNLKIDKIYSPILFKFYFSFLVENDQHQISPLPLASEIFHIFLRFYWVILAIDIFISSSSFWAENRLFYKKFFS